MKKLYNALSIAIVILTIGFNLYLYRAENTILSDPNDNIFQYSLIYRTSWVWENFGCPFSLSCLPNLIDHNVPTWAEGYPLPTYYSHVPQILTVASYKMIVTPISHVFHSNYSLFQYYTFTRYLLLCIFPLIVFIALRIVGFDPLLSAVSAFFSAHFSTDGLYGIDPTSFLWRGYGLTSQLYGMMGFPIAIALTYKAMKEPKVKTIILASTAMILTTMGHLGMGIQALLMSASFIFIDIRPREILNRVKYLGIIGVTTVGVLSYWIVPAMLFDAYHITSEWDPIWKFNSYGWYEVIRQLFAGEIFDWGRLPTVTTLVILGLFSALLITKPNKKQKETLPFVSFALAFLFSLLLYFGRTTWGGLIDLIPGMSGYHLHRFIVSVEIAGIFLIPLGIYSIYHLLETLLKYLQKNIVAILNMGGAKEGTRQRASRINMRGALMGGIMSDRTHKITSVILCLIIILMLGYTTVSQSISYAKPNDEWIKSSNTAFVYDQKNFENLLTYLNSLPNGRVYAGRPGNWGKDFRLGSTQMYMLLGIHGFDMSQFLPETWSPLSENEQNFDERTSEDYDLLNIRTVVATKNEGFAKNVTLQKTFGPFQVFNAPSTGWFDIVTSPMAVLTKKTDFLNIVHLWHRSYPRRWKMHPIISVDKNPLIPATNKRTIKMVDSVNYEENGLKKNIFTDFPLYFPESTPSGKILSEKVDKQTYQTTVDVPNNCTSCMVMFKMSYHPNWHVKVDGVEVEKFAVFPFYLAASVSSGKHIVEFWYEPNGFKIFLLYFTPLILVGGLIGVRRFLRK